MHTRSVSVDDYLLRSKSTLEKGTQFLLERRFDSAYEKAKTLIQKGYLTYQESNALFDSRDYASVDKIEFYLEICQLRELNTDNSKSSKERLPDYLKPIASAYENAWKIKN